MILTKEEILAAPDVPREEVEVPEWGGTVIVTGLTGYGREQIEAEVVGSDGVQRVTTNFMAKLAALSIVGADGHRLFEYAEAVVLGEKSPKALGRIFDVALRLSGLSSKIMEEMVGNLPSGQDGSSSSDSPSPSDSPTPTT